MNCYIPYFSYNRQTTNQARNNARFLIVYVALMSVVIGLSGCGKKAAENPDATPAVTAPTSINPENIQQVVGTGRVETQTKLSGIYSEVSGIITKLNVAEGQSVKAGDVIAELATRTEQARLSELQQAVQTAQSQIPVTQASIAAIQLKISKTKDKYDRLLALYKKQAETLQNVDNAQLEYDANVKEQQRLEASFASQQQAVREGQSRVNAAQTEIDRRTIKAPMDGTILTLTVGVGSAVNALSPFAEFAPAEALIVQTEIDELFAERIQLGQKGQIRKYGSDVVVATGEVIYVAPYLKKKSLFSETSGDLEDRRVRPVKLRINDGSALLLGSRVETVIQLK
jgi:HlyD family secretion protein